MTARDQYEIYRQQVAGEATWSAHRTAWLLTANSFLFTALAIMGTSSVALSAGAAQLRNWLPAAGIVLNLGTLTMLAMAEWVTVVRVREYGKLPSDAGANLPALDGGRVPHVVGAYVPMMFALGGAVLWLKIAFA